MKKIEYVAILHSDVVKHQDSDKWVLDNDAHYTITYEEGGICQCKKGTILKGYRWNGADIPWAAQWLIGNPMDEVFAIPSMFHDYGIENEWRGILRDKVFRVLLQESKVKTWKIPRMFRGVVAWRKLSNWWESW